MTPVPEKLEPKVEGKGRRWWESKLVISLLALVIPLTTGVKEFMQMTRETVRAQQRQDHEIQMQYLTFVTSTKLGIRNRKMVLRFLAYTADKKEAQDWAEAELVLVRKEEAQSAKALSAREQRENNYFNEIKQLRERLSRAEQSSASLREASDRLKSLTTLTEINRGEIERLRKELDNPIPPAPTNIRAAANRYQCVPGTILASGTSGTLALRQQQCQDSLSANGIPPAGIINISDLSYSWITDGLACNCVVSLAR